MTKRIMTLLVLLALAGLFYATSEAVLWMTAKASGGGEVPTATAQPSQTPAQKNTPTVCNVQTGIEGGAVNLRTCGGVSCAVLDIVTEGEGLTVVTSGAWMSVTTEDGVTGWINSRYCKGK